MDWTELVPTLVKTPITIYKNKETIQKLWKKLQVLCNLGKTDILILGRPAVGKSLLSSHLYGETTNLGYELPKTSRDVETNAIQLGTWTQIVRVVPGQKTSERIISLKKTFEEGNVPDGIIYTVDWGYTDVRDSLAKKIIIEEERIDTIDKLRDYNLKQELEDLKEVLDIIKFAFVTYKKPLWIIIAVNKVDLFYNKLNEAQRYYSLEYKSDFTDLMNNFLNDIGTLNIKCKVLPISSWQKDLVWNNVLIETKLGGKENEKALTLNFIDEISNF